MKGFTLIETLIALAILGLISLYMTSFFKNQNLYYNRQINSIEIRGDVRSAMDMVIREASMAGYNPHKIKFNGIEFKSDTLKIRADLNEDGDLMDDNEFIQYVFDENNMLRITSTDTVIMLENMTGYSMVFKDKKDDIITDTIKYGDIVKAEFFVEAQTKIKNTRGSFSLRSSVSPKNLSIKD